MYEIKIDVDNGPVISRLGSGSTLADALRLGEIMQQVAYEKGSKIGRNGKPVIPTVTIRMIAER